MDTRRHEYRLHDLTVLDSRAFVDSAFHALLGRDPTPEERCEFTARLLRGEPKTAVLGALRFSAEGRVQGVHVAGLLGRHIAQTVFRVPFIGYAFEWVSALLKLPLALRFGRHIEQRQATAIADIEAAIAAMRADIATNHSDQATAAKVHADAIKAHAEVIKTQADAMQAQAALHETLEANLAGLRDRVAPLQASVDRLLPADLPPVLELRGEPLVAPTSMETAGGSAQQRFDDWYGEFERVFYQSHVVAEKQRVYLPYLDRALAERYPFLDLGCGRGEFMSILRAAGIPSVGVDLSTGNVERLRRAGHEAHEGDLITFLEHDTRTYSGAVALQVVEHIPAAAFERMLELLRPRLAPGATLIIESVNPHSPFALGNFHMDPTHIAPIPPDRVRFCMERAGFVRTCALFQAPIPAFAFGGPEARAHYCDYAVIGYRP